MNLAGRVGRESSVRWSWLGVAYGTPVRAYRSWWAGPVAEARADLAAYRDRLQKADGKVRREAAKALRRTSFPEPWVVMKKPSIIESAHS